MARGRPPGISSRVRRVPGPRHRWIAPNGSAVELPVLVDILENDEALTTVWKVVARIDLFGDQPALVSVHVDSIRAIDTDVMQLHFRWVTPLEIVTITVPQLIAAGIDPFRYHYPRDGYPEAASVERSAPTRLTDDFLTEIATRYLLLGRGYAKTIAKQRNVSPRTVVSWIEKAHERGILSGTTPGSMGGVVVTRRATR